MTFANLSAAWAAAGLVGLAALLYALQHLTTRRREMTVVTTIFWRQAVEEAPVRRFWDRFRHPWAYLLLLAICALIWLGVAEPRFERAEDRTFYVLVLDGSAGMAAGGRFRAAIERLTQQVSRLPADRRQVLWSGAQTRTLLNPGEHAVLLDRRLASLAPEAAPSTFERLLRQLAASASRTRATSIVLFGDAPVRAQIVDGLAPTISLRRAGASPMPLTGNAGITALGVAEAASGAWDRVDVRVEIQRTSDRGPIDPREVRIDLDGRALSSAAIETADSEIGRVGQPADRAGERGGQADVGQVDEAGRALVVRDLPAKGGLFTVKLTATDSLPLDDVARVRLPDRPVVRVLLSPSLAPIVAPALDADPGVMLTADDPQVVIRRAGEPIGGTRLPALEFVSAARQPQAFFLTHPEALDSTIVFGDAVRTIGLTQIDAMSLAQTAQRPIEVSIAAGRQWRFSVWDELLSEDYNFTQSRSFPLFVANAVRWLAGTPAWYPAVAAGQPLVPIVTGERPSFADARGRVLDPIGPAFVPAKAGELWLASGAPPLSVSLLDPGVTTGRVESAFQPASLAPFETSSPPSMLTWLLLAAIVLLGLEWYLFQNGRLP